MSFDEIRRHLDATFTTDQAVTSATLVQVVVPMTRQGRRQRVTIHEVRADDGTAFAAISTPVAPLAGVDPLDCLRLNNRMVRGFLSVSTTGKQPFVMLCATLPLDTLEPSHLDQCITSLAQTADNLEAELTEGRDTF